MQPTLDTLNNLTPVFIFGFLALFMILERQRPYFAHGANRGKQRRRNVVVIVIAALVSIGVTVFSGMAMSWSGASRLGATYGPFGRSVLWIVLGIFLIDLCGYVAHVCFHKVPAFWRIHRVHHADAELDASSGLRAHPLELIFVITGTATVVALLGVPLASSVLYGAIALPWFSLNHSNMRFPAWFENWGRLLMSTPNWHRIHHSSYQPETDSNYGCLFSIWDRLFRTSRYSNIESIRFGIDRFREPGDQTVGGLLKMPFMK